MKLRRALGWLPFLALCVLLSTRWMFSGAWPDSQSTLASEAVALLGSGLCLAPALRRERPSKSVWRGMLRTAAAGAVLFAALNSGLLFPETAPRSTDLLVSLALTPVVVAVAYVAGGGLEGGLNGADLAPGLLAVGGLLLVVAVPSLTSWQRDALLLAAPLGVGISAAWLGSGRDGLAPPLRAEAALLGAAILFGILFGALALRTPRTAPALSATGLDLLVVLLTVSVLVGRGARAFSAQFALVPWLLSLEGLLLTRVRPNWEQAAGLLLLPLAALLLLRQPRPGEREQSPRLFT